MVTITGSEGETRAVAARLAATLEPGSVLLLSGDLGAGKTAFVKGLLEGLGGDSDEVSSPTFVLVQLYRSGRMPLVHVDLYRLASAELDTIGLDPEVTDRGVLAIEWPDRLAHPPPESIEIRLTDAGDDVREISVSLAK